MLVRRQKITSLLEKYFFPIGKKTGTLKTCKTCKLAGAPTPTHVRTYNKIARIYISTHIRVCGCESPLQVCKFASLQESTRLPFNPHRPSSTLIPNADVSSAVSRVPGFSIRFPLSRQLLPRNYRVDGKRMRNKINESSTNMN